MEGGGGGRVNTGVGWHRGLLVQPGEELHTLSVASSMGWEKVTRCEKDMGEKMLDVFGTICRPGRAREPPGREPASPPPVSLSVSLLSPTV